MYLDSRLFQRSARPHPAPAALLGAGHPLVRALERQAVAVYQLVAVAAVCVGSGGAWLDGYSDAAPLIAAGAATELLLTARVAVVHASCRVQVLKVISEARADLPLIVVERMGDRLRCRRHRDGLVAGIDALLTSKVQRWDFVVIPWRFGGTDVTAPIDRELLEVRALLRDDSAGLAGIALVELLLTEGASSLHGDDPRRLHEDLSRARFLLSSRRGSDQRARGRSRRG